MTRKRDTAGEAGSTAAPAKAKTGGSKPARVTSGTARGQGAPHLRAVEAPGAPSGGDAPIAGEAASKPGHFKRQDLIEAVSARSAVKRSDVKAIVDLTLEELGRALDEQTDLALAPLGKLTIKRRLPETGPAETLTLKLRRAKANKEDGEETPLAAASEDS